jgi:hypothetical protein
MTRVCGKAVLDLIAMGSTCMQDVAHIDVGIARMPLTIARSASFC